LPGVTVRVWFAGFSFWRLFLSSTSTWAFFSGVRRPCRAPSFFFVLETVLYRPHLVVPPFSPGLPKTGVFRFFTFLTHGRVLPSLTFSFLFHRPLRTPPPSPPPFFYVLKEHFLASCETDRIFREGFLFNNNRWAPPGPTLQGCRLVVSKVLFPLVTPGGAFFFLTWHGACRSGADCFFVFYIFWTPPPSEPPWKKKPILPPGAGSLS